jgi:hypothetical protein
MSCKPDLNGFCSGYAKEEIVMTIQDVIDNYRNSKYSKYLEEPPFLISIKEAFDCPDYWITPRGEMISCGYAEHKTILEMLKEFNSINVIDERDAELQGWVKVSGGMTHIVNFPVKKSVKDIIIFHFAMNGNKLWLGGGHYPFNNIEKLERWLDGGQYEPICKKGDSDEV